MKKILFTSALVVAACAVRAESPSIFESLATPDSVTGAAVVVYQDSLLRHAVEVQQLHGADASLRGFRVQLFSSNNARTARATAFKVEKTVREKLPHLAVYVTYTSPFWKVRVGNCVSNYDAQRLRQYIIEQLPQFQAETYVVPDQILLNQ